MLEHVYQIYSVLGMVGVGLMITFLIDHICEEKIGGTYNSPGPLLITIWVLATAIQLVIVFLVIQ